MIKMIKMITALELLACKPTIPYYSLMKHLLKPKKIGFRKQASS